MRVGIGMHFSNTDDWDRFEASERHEDVPPAPATPDWDILQEDLAMADLTEELGFDSLWSVEHHVTPVPDGPEPAPVPHLHGRSHLADRPRHHGHRPALAPAAAPGRAGGVPPRGDGGGPLPQAGRRSRHRKTGVRVPRHRHGRVPAALPRGARHHEAGPRPPTGSPTTGRSSPSPRPRCAHGAGTARRSSTTWPALGGARRRWPSPRPTG